MKHYDIVLLVHPDQSEQVTSMVERYKTPVVEQNENKQVPKYKNHKGGPGKGPGGKDGKPGGNPPPKN